MKGKYAKRATLRREDADVQAQIASCQRNVERLTAENKRLTAERIEILAEHKQAVGQMKAQLAERVSPEVIELREELERQRKLAGASSSRLEERQETYEKLLTFTTNLLHHVTGCTGLEATERVIVALGAREGFSIVDTNAGADRSLLKEVRSAEQVHMLQRSRGFRSSPKVIEHLDAVCRAAAAPGPKVRRVQ